MTKLNNYINLQTETTSPLIKEYNSFRILILFFLFLSLFNTEAFAQEKKVEEIIKILPSGKVYLHEFDQRIKIKGIDDSTYTSVSIKIFKKNKNGDISAIDKLDLRTSNSVSVQLSKQLKAGVYLIVIELYNNNSYLPVYKRNIDFKLIDKKILSFANNSFAIKFSNKKGKYTSDTAIAKTSFSTTPSEMGIQYNKKIHNNFLKLGADLEDFTVEGKVYSNIRILFDYAFNFLNRDNYNLFYGPHLGLKQIKLITTNSSNVTEADTMNIIDLGLFLAVEKKINQKIIIFSNFTLLPLYQNEDYMFETNYTFTAGLEFFVEFPFSVFFNLSLESYKYRNEEDETIAILKNNGIDFGLKYSF